MLKTLRNAFKIKDVRRRLFYVLLKKAKVGQREEFTIPKRGEYLSAKTHDKIFFYVSMNSFP